MTKLRRILAGICLAVAATVVAIPGAAQAGPGKTKPVDGIAGSPVSDSAAIESAAEYWTAERMAAATPADVPVSEMAPGAGTTSSDQVERLAERALASPVESVAGAPLRTTGVQDAWFSYTNGKVFFFNPNEPDPNRRNKVCSGSAVNSARKRLVLTAGHCVHGGQGQTWMEQWIFVPGYHQGWEPNGRFGAYQFWTSTGWINSSDRGRDFAFVITHNNAGGSRVVDAAGGHGLIVNPGRPFVHIAGYPVDRDGGQVQWYCWGTTSSWSLFDGGQKLRCNFTGGASGGPWLRDYAPNGLGNAISDTHGIATDGSGDNYGPYFDNHTADVYFAADGASP